MLDIVIKSCYTVTMEQALVTVSQEVTFMTQQDKRAFARVAAEVSCLSPEQRKLFLAYASGFADGANAAEDRKRTKEE